MRKIKSTIRIIVQNWFKIVIVIAVIWIGINITRIASNVDFLSFTMRQQFFPIDFNF